MKHDDNNLSIALKFRKRCHQKYLNDEMNLVMGKDLCRKNFVRVEEEGNAKLRKLEKECSVGLLMYEEY